MLLVVTPFFILTVIYDYIVWIYTIYLFLKLFIYYFLILDYTESLLLQGDFL